MFMLRIDVSCEKRSNSTHTQWVRMLPCWLSVQAPSSSVEHAMRALPGSERVIKPKSECVRSHIASARWRTTYFELHVIRARAHGTAYSQFPSLTSLGDSARKHELRFGNEFFGSSDVGNGDLIMYASLADSEMGERFKICCHPRNKCGKLRQKFQFPHLTFTNLKHVCAVPRSRNAVRKTITIKSRDSSF